MNIRLIAALQCLNQSVGVSQKKNAVSEIYVFFREPLKLGHEFNLCRVLFREPALSEYCYLSLALAGVSMNQTTRYCCRFVDIFSPPAPQPPNFTSARHCLAFTELSSRLGASNPLQRLDLPPLLVDYNSGGLLLARKAACKLRRPKCRDSGHCTARIKHSQQETL